LSISLPVASVSLFALTYLIYHVALRLVEHDPQRPFRALSHRKIERRISPGQADSDNEIFQLEKRAFFSKVSCQMRRTREALVELIDKYTDMAVCLSRQQIPEAWGLSSV
jgi:hypothetical protein